MDAQLDRDAAEFVEGMLRIMDRKHHPFWDHLHSPRATHAEWIWHLRQEWAVYVRDFPAYLRAIHERCPVEPVRHDLMENILEEEAGAVSGAGSHAELFLRMVDGFRAPRGLFDRVPLLSEAEDYRGFLDSSAKGPWHIGAAVLTVFVEGSVQDRAEVTNGHAPAQQTEDDPFQRHPLVLYQRLHPSALELKRVHRRVEGGHRRDAYRALAGYVTDHDDRDDVLRAVERARALWMRYRDAVAETASKAA